MSKFENISEAGTRDDRVALVLSLNSLQVS